MNGSINIISGFSVGAPYPIDYRMVMPNTTERDAIVHKYDGLTVFITDTRESWTWNSVSSTWETKSGIGGGGSASFVPKWVNSQTIGNSNIYTDSDRIGINTTSPLGHLHIINSNYGGYSSMLFDIPDSQTGIIGYNSLFAGANGVAPLDITHGSISITFKSSSNTSYISFNHRKPGDALYGTHTSKLTLGHKNSLSEYCNVLNGINARNYIIGTSSVSNSLGSTDTSKDLLMVNGSFRSSGMYSKQTTYIDYQVIGLGYSMVITYYNNNTSDYNNTQTFTTPTTYLNPQMGTYQMLNEHELVVYNRTGGAVRKDLSITLPTNPEIGREIVIDYMGGTGIVGDTNIPTCLVRSSIITNIAGSNVTYVTILKGERIKIVYIGGSTPTWQVVELVSDNQLIKSDVKTLMTNVNLLSGGSTGQVFKKTGTGVLQGAWGDDYSIGLKTNQSYNIKKLIYTATPNTISAGDYDYGFTLTGVNIALSNIISFSVSALVLGGIQNTNFICVVSGINLVFMTVKSVGWDSTGISATGGSVIVELTVKV